MQVVVDKNTCQGHAQCIGAAPQVFRMGADGCCEVLIESVDERLRPGVETAQAFCPSGSISLLD